MEKLRSLPTPLLLVALFVTATCIPEKLELAGGHRYKNARRPELYGNILGKAHDAQLKVEWMKRSK